MHLDPGIGLKIRAMAEGDLDQVMEIASSLPTAPRWTRSAYEAAIAGPGASRDSGSEGPIRIALTAELLGEVIGFAIARVVAGLAEVETIAITEKAQGCGAGSALLGALVEGCRLAGSTEAELEVRSSNDRALRLYKRAGFEEAGRRRGYYHDPVEDGLVLRLFF